MIYRIMLFSILFFSFVCVLGLKALHLENIIVGASSQLTSKKDSKRLFQQLARLSFGKKTKVVVPKRFIRLKLCSQLLAFPNRVKFI